MDFPDAVQPCVTESLTRKIVSVSIASFPGSPGDQMEVIMFAKNVGSVDRVLRVLAGLALLLYAFGYPTQTGWNWVGFIGVIPLLTAAFGTCPLYGLIGVNTCGTKA